MSESDNTAYRWGIFYTFEDSEGKRRAGSYEVSNDHSTLSGEDLAGMLFSIHQIFGHRNIEVVAHHLLEEFELQKWPKKT